MQLNNTSPDFVMVFVKCHTHCTVHRKNCVFTVMNSGQCILLLMSFSLNKGNTSFKYLLVGGQQVCFQVIFVVY